MTSRDAFRIGHVLKLSWALFVKNVKVWFIPLVVMDFISWRVLSDLWDMVPRYVDSKLNVELSAMVRAFGDEMAVPGTHDVAVVAVQVSIAIASSILSAVVISPLIYESIDSGRMRIRSREIVERLQRDDLIAQVMRSAGITFVAYAGIAMAVTPLILLTRAGLPAGVTLFAGALILMVCLEIMVLSFLAVPVAVVEDVGVVKSMKRSWALSWRRFLRMIGALVSTQVVVYAVVAAAALVVAIVVGIGIEVGGWTAAGEGSQGRVMAITVATAVQVGALIGSFVIAIVWSACYYHLRAAEAGEHGNS